MEFIDHLLRFVHVDLHLSRLNQSVNFTVYRFKVEKSKGSKSQKGPGLGLMEFTISYDLFNFLTLRPFDFKTVDREVYTLI